ncbi:MAG: transporter substrate-binding domain-containing protein [Clostridia bacterium]|nr:transporter substrate-binding domain-containing protein [Clostridia bacterium]
MRTNPYKIGKSKGLSPRLKNRLNDLPSLKGKEGRWLRIVLIALGVILLGVIAAVLLKPETRLMSSVEIKRIESKGVLSVAVRDDMPGFCEDGKGLEAELARLLAEKILPDSEEPVKLVPCSSKTLTAKLKDGSADIAIAMQPATLGSAYSYSYPYYTDTVYLMTLTKEASEKAPTELKIGYIPDTPAGNVFASYAAGINKTPEQGLIDRLLKKPKPTPDPNAPTVESVKLGSYDDLLAALKKGDIDAAVMSGVYINKYCRVLADKTEITEYYLSETEIGRLRYCIIASSDEPALAQLADMLIYEMQENGSLERLIAEYV